MDIGSLLNSDTPLPLAAILNPTPEHSINSSTPTSPNHSTISSTPPTPCLPDIHLPPDVTAKKRELRMVGQRHRDKERSHVTSLYDTIHALQQENHRLFALCTATLSRPAQVSAAELRSMLKSQVQLIRGTHRVSDVAAAKLGVRYLTGAMALLLLETIACRRNLTVKRTGRQRSSDLVCARPGVFEAMIASGVAQLRREAALPLSDAILVFGGIHAQWAGMEGSSVSETMFRDAPVYISSTARRHRALQGIAKTSNSGYCNTSLRCHGVAGRGVITEFSEVNEDVDVDDRQYSLSVY